MTSKGPFQPKTFYDSKLIPEVVFFFFFGSPKKLGIEGKRGKEEVRCYQSVFLAYAIFYKAS